MGIRIKAPEGAVGSATPAIVIGLFVAFGGVLFGYDTGTISGILAMKYWLKIFSTGEKDKNGDPTITSTQKSIMVSILSLGTFLGALTAAPVADKTGRRWGIIISTGVFSAGVAMKTAATSIPLFTCGRFFAGYGVGMISAMIPLYQSETSPKWIRGTIVGAYQLAITIGLLLAAIINNMTARRDDTGSYRIPIGIQFFWAIIMVGGMLILPESPRWFVKRGRNTEAAHSLHRLRRLPVDHPALVQELNEIVANHEYELSLGKATYIDCFKGNLGKRLFTGCSLQGLQQLTGINFIFYYGTSFFVNSGINQPFIISMITSCVNVVSTLPGLYLVEKWGRRKLLLFGAGGMAFSQFVVAILGTVAGKDNLPAQKALIAFICIYIFFFACSWGPVAWVVTGEIFPLKVRAKSLSMTTASNWALNFVIAFATPYLVDKGKGSLGLEAKVFFIWGTACFICIIFVYTMIYETKGLALEEVDELYMKITRAWKSPGFVPSVSFQEVQDMNTNTRNMSLTDLEANANRKRSIQHQENEINRTDSF